MLLKGVNSPVTSSVGRLFDAVASFIGVRQIVNFEGQAAMELEFLTPGIETQETYSFTLKKLQPSSAFLLIDWQPMFLEILDDVKNKVLQGTISAKFHNTLTEIIVAVAHRIGRPWVVLSGGCFQNRYLTERTVRRLQEEGFRPYWHQRVPPNDGGISLGQVYAVLHKRGKDS
jgi:hydrogenase maturation protein HypF